jgi:formylglycine-generating enzyme required for sulfatase activity
MDEHELIRSGQQRLALYRRTVDFLSAQHGQAGAPASPDLERQLDDTRRQIWQIKRELRALGVVVEDHPNDGDNRLSLPIPQDLTAAGGTLVLQYQRILADQLRLLSLPAISSSKQLSLPLVDLYVERTLAGGALAGSAAPDLEQATPTLGGLLRTPGARVLLEGERGVGKTTCVRRLALACVASATGEPARAAEPVATWAGAAPLPLLLSAHELESTLDGDEAALSSGAQPAPPRVWLAIEARLRNHNLGLVAPILQQALDQGGCLILVDGLDGGPESQATKKLLAALDDFIACYPGNRFVVASRCFDAAASVPLAGFSRYSLAPLERVQIDTMIERWYQALAGVAELDLGGDIAERIVRLQGLLHGDELLEELAASPLLLALWILAHAEGYALPAARGIIHTRECELLLEGWGHNIASDISGLGLALGLEPGATADLRLTLIQPLALTLQSRRNRDADLPPPLGAPEIEHLLHQPLLNLGVEPTQVSEQGIPRLIEWCCGAGLLAEVEPEAYRIPRRSLCEYLAARALSGLPDFLDRARGLRHDPRWREALALVVYELAREPASQAYELVRLLIWPPETAGGSDRHDLLLAAECLAAIAELPAAEQPLCEEVRRRLVELIGAGQAGADERVQAGTLLGRLGDPRFGGPLPPLAAVAAGAFTLGSQGGYEDEGPARRIDVPAFEIGVYPVTNQEYALFLDDTTHPEPRYWHDLRFNNPSYPVVGVTWHDAMAYCAWLNARLAQAGLLAADSVVRLPLEVEWEKAASWDPRLQAKRLYPWGDDWSNTRANTAGGRGTWLTTPVGCYPEGVSAYGLHDCIGNVWEWTASVYSSYQGAATQFHEAGSYTLRGSSCISLSNQARCTFRSRLPANYWRYHLGFRIVIARPLSATTPL